MGTDIFDFVERLEDDGSWRCVAEELYFGADRCYALFGILAGVRSGGIQPIVPPRGLPTHLVDEFSAHPYLSDRADSYQEFLEDYHSASWLMLSELISFPWETTYRQFPAYLNADEFSKRERGAAYEYERVSCRYPDDSAPVPCPKPGWQIVSQSEMRSHVVDGTATSEMRCLLWQDESYAELADLFLLHGLPALEALGSPDRVRWVFFFDS